MLELEGSHRSSAVNDTTPSNWGRMIRIEYVWD